MEETQFASIVFLVLSVFISKRFDPAEITSLEEKNLKIKKKIETWAVCWGLVLTGSTVT